MTEDFEPRVWESLDRDRLTSAAWRASEQLRRSWSLTSQQISDLIGANDADVDQPLTSEPPMSDEQLHRVGLLVGIYADLHRLHSTGLADAWMTRPNSNDLFHGQPPVVTMTAGGLAAIIEVRDLLAGRVAGA